MNSSKYIHSIVCAALIATPCMAQSDSKDAKVIIPAPIEENTWEYSISPYLWLSGIDGTSGIHGQEVDVDIPLDDAIDMLDFAGYLAFKAQKGKWGYYADFQYLKLSGSQATPIGFLADKLTVDLEQFTSEAGVKYSLYQTDKTLIQIMAGAQYTYFSVDAKAKGRISASIGDSEDWIDPTIGLTLIHKFNEKWNLHLTGQVGGFGVASDSTWMAMGGVGYTINDCWRAILGYRHQYIDYEKGDFLYDINVGGPMLGVVYEF